MSLRHTTCICWFCFHCKAGNTMAAVGEHVSRVRALYKAILKLHRGLPLHMQALGDQYVKEEFRRHKEAQKQEVDIFMREWTVSVTGIANTNV